MNTERELLIYTWGKSCRKYKPQDSQINFNAGILKIDRKELILKNKNGLSKDVQQIVKNSTSFMCFIAQIVNKIKSDNTLHCISINCKEGRHRSVSVAEMLKQIYFPNAQIIHLELG